MRLTHSFWSKPCFENRWGLKDTFDKNIWLTTLSCIYAKMSGAYITLHCDSIAYLYLKYLPYDEIYIDLDCLNDIKSRSTIFWAAGKAIALEKEPLGTIHIDNDVFIKSKKCLDALNFDNYDLIVSHLEIADYPDKKHFKEIFPKNIINAECAYNTGVIGFNSLELKDKYLSNYSHYLNTVECSDKYACIDLILELIYIKELSKYNKVKLLLWSKNNNIHQKAKSIDFAHLIGHSKYKKINNILRIIKKLNINIYNTLCQKTELKNYILGRAY